MGLKLCLALGALLLPLAAQAQAVPPAPAIVRLDPAFDKLVAPGTQMELLAGGFASTEGPIWHEGKLFISDIHDGLIYAIDEQGNKSVVVRDAGGPIDPAITVAQGPNGLAPYRNGDILVCRQGLRDIEVLHKDGSFTPFVSKFEGKRFNSPNDLVFAADGALWFTDPPFSTPGGRGADNPNRELPWSAVFRYKDGVLTPVIKDMELPNGIGFSPDGKILYVSNTAPTYIRAYDVGKDGTLSNAREFFRWEPNAQGTARGVPDGLKVDVLGNVWATGIDGVNVISPQGKLLGRLQGKGRSSNIAFGGQDGRTVFVTGGDSLYRVKALVQGEAALYEKR